MMHVDDVQCMTSLSQPQPISHTPVDILDVRFDTPTPQRIAEFLTSSAQHAIYTPNAEMLVFAHADRNFRELLNRTSMNICDGSGPAYLARLLERKQVERVSGTDFLLRVLEVSSQEGKSVFLLGSGDTKVLEVCIKEFTQKFPAIQIVGSHPGIKLDLADMDGIHTLVYDDADMEDMTNDIIMAAPDVLIVAFGHPKQELFIDIFLDQLPSIRLAMGVGGALDFYAGKVRRAPQWMRTLGLESVWRLLLQPWRWKRVFTALVIFPILYVLHVIRDT